MTARPSLIQAIADHVAEAGTGPAARRAANGWRQVHPVLRKWGQTPAEITASACQAQPGDKDELLSSLLCEAPKDEWAQLTVLAILAPRLCWIVGCWARHPGARSELAELEADLVAECWTAIAHPSGGPTPGRPSFTIVDRAWSRVRDRRTRERRRTSRHNPIGSDREPTVPASDARRTSADALAAAVNQAFAAGDLTLGSARALYLTRVTGLSTEEAAHAMGTDPHSVRALRSRAARRLTAA